MRTTPMTEEEIAEAGLMADGTYDVEITEATDMTSKAGNDMIQLVLRIHDGEGGTRTLRDYLLDAMPGKLRHAAVAFGELDAYMAGAMDAASLEGKAARVKIGRRAGQNGYGPQNVVLDYIAIETGAAPTRKPAARKPAMAGSLNDLDDEVPF